MVCIDLIISYNILVDSLYLFTQIIQYAFIGHKTSASEVVTENRCGNNVYQTRTKHSTSQTMCKMSTVNEATQLLFCWDGVENLFSSLVGGGENCCVKVGPLGNR